MKTNILSVLLANIFLASLNASATIYVPSPPGNIVQNGSFLGYSFSYWTWIGNGQIDGNPNAPNGIFALPTDIYQVLPTSPGQQYALNFYMAADLYLAPSVTVNVTLNGQRLTSITTPPYTYNNRINRDDQMRWQGYAYTFTASQTNTRLEFIDTTTYDFGLAAVSVVPVPEPSGIAFLCMTLIVASFAQYRSKRIKA